MIRDPSASGVNSTALAYYYDHREELDRDIARRLRKVDELQTRLGDSPIARKLKALKTRS